MARFSGGWVKAYREIYNGKRDGHDVAILIWLLTRANYKPSFLKTSSTKHITLQPGEIATSVSEIATATGFSRSMIFRRLKYLEECGTILQKSKRKGSIITICNYDEYQKSDSDAETQLKRTRNAPRTLIKEYKKEKNFKKDTQASPVAPHKVNLFIMAYSDAWEAKYNCKAPVIGKDHRIAKRLLQHIELDELTKLVRAYLSLNLDPLFVSSKFSLAVFESSLPRIKAFSETGSYVTLQEAQTRERKALKWQGSQRI